jgi:hypothetical protein
LFFGPNGGDQIGFTYNVSCANATPNDFLEPMFMNQGVGWGNNWAGRPAPAHTCVQNTMNGKKMDLDVSVMPDESSATLSSISTAVAVGDACDCNDAICTTGNNVLGNPICG